MNKELTVKGEKFEFIYMDLSNQWFLEKFTSVAGYKLNLEFSENDFPDNSFGWEDLQSFMDYILSNQQDLEKNIIDSQYLLKIFLERTSGSAYSKMELEYFVFEPAGFDFKASRKSSLSPYVFDILFFLYDQRSAYKDMGSVIWRASFVQTELKGVMREI